MTALGRLRYSCSKLCGSFAVSTQDLVKSRQLRYLVVALGGVSRLVSRQNIR